MEAFNNHFFNAPSHILMQGKWKVAHTCRLFVAGTGSAAVHSRRTCLNRACLVSSSSHLNGCSQLSLPPCAQLLRRHQRLQRTAALAQLSQVALHGCANVLCTQSHDALQYCMSNTTYFDSE